MKEFVYKPLRVALRDGMVKVTFTKKNGDVRVMDCTTNVELAGHMFKEPDQNAVQVADKPDLYRVVDIDADGFRSFNHDQIISYEYDGGIVVHNVKA
jgi:hypothetical protein